MMDTAQIKININNDQYNLFKRTVSVEMFGYITTKNIVNYGLFIKQIKKKTEMVQTSG